MPFNVAVQRGRSTWPFNGHWPCQIRHFQTWFKSRGNLFRKFKLIWIQPCCAFNQIVSMRIACWNFSSVTTDFNVRWAASDFWHGRNKNCSFKNSSGQKNRAKILKIIQHQLQYLWNLLKNYEWIIASPNRK